MSRQEILFARAIADYYAINNAITDEWLVRDYGGVAEQIGGPLKNAAQLIEARAALITVKNRHPPQ